MKHHAVALYRKGEMMHVLFIVLAVGCLVGFLACDKLNPDPPHDKASQ